MLPRSISVFALLALASGCTTSAGVVGDHPEGSSAADEADDTLSEADSEADSGGWKLDASNTEGSAEAGELACEKVDFVFVIDASQSMIGEQNNLIDNFPTFIAGLESTVAAEDFQLGVHTSDDDPMGWNTPACTGELSALVARTGGMWSSQSACAPFANGLNFMTPADELEQAFACAAAVGTDGGGRELPMQTVIEVVQEPLDAPGACNQGYLRDDSLLVVVVITDEADGPGDPEANNDPDATSPGDPDAWFDAVVAARGGVESNIVMLTLANYAGGPCPPEMNVNDGANLVEFTEKFTHGIVGGVCEADYGPYFAQAIAVIDDACDDYTPVG